MKKRHLGYLCCPECKNDFYLDIAHSEQEEIISGTLSCSTCRKKYQISAGIPRIISENLEVDKKKLAEAFSFEWKGFNQLTDKYREQFLDWIAPVDENFFKGKVILDAGCGKGRHAFWSAKFGAKDVIGIDLGSTVEVAKENTKEFNNVSIIQADIYNLPLKPVFDYVYSIGVIHHLPNPATGFDALVKKLSPNGRISAWVYGREGNDWIVHILNPIRTFVTSRLPLPITKFIAFGLTCIMQPIIKIIYRPINKIIFLQPLKKFLFYNDYLYSISGFSFQENYSIVFDHILAPTAFYITKKEFEGWFSKNNLKDVKISWRNKNSWRGTGVRQA